MDVDRPDDLAPPPPAPPVLLLHETVAGWPSPPASFLATVRLRKACAVSSIVVVPVGEAVFEHAALDSFGSTPRTPADIELLFNVRFAPPAVAPPGSRANKLQKVVLEYRPDTEDAAGRSGGQAFELAMPRGITTNLLVLRSTLPLLTVLIYGEPPASDPAPPPPEPDWSTFVRLRDGSGRPPAPAFGAADPRLPAVHLLASGWQADEWHRLYAGLAALDGVPATLADRRPSTSAHPRQATLEDLLDRVVEGGKELTDWLKRAPDADADGADTEMRAEAEPAAGQSSATSSSTADVGLALAHVVELLAASDTGANLAVPPSGPEVILMAVLLLLSVDDRSAAACAVAADAILALLGSDPTRDVVLASFAAGASASGPQQPSGGSVWDLGLWASVLGVSSVVTALDSTAERASFSVLVQRLEAASFVPVLGSTQPAPSPAALLAFLAAVVHVSSAGAIVADLAHAAGLPLNPPHEASSHGSLEGADGAQLDVALRSLNLWCTDRSAGPLCQVILARPSLLGALCALVAHSDEPVTACVGLIVTHVLSSPASAPALASFISHLPADTTARLAQRLSGSPRALAQLDIARSAFYTRHIPPTLATLARTALAPTLDEADMFELQLWLHHLLARLRTSPGSFDWTAEAEGLLSVHEHVARAQRSVLGRDTSFARDRLAGLDRAGAVLSLGLIDALVLEALALALRPRQAKDGGAALSRENALVDSHWRRSLVRRAARCAVVSHATAAYAGDAAYLDAFCPTSTRPALLATTGRQLQASLALVQALAHSGTAGQSSADFGSVLDGLLGAALADPAVAASSAVGLLAPLLSLGPSSDAGAWATTVSERKEDFAQLSCFLREAERAALAGALSLSSVDVGSSIPAPPPPAPSTSLAPLVLLVPATQPATDGALVLSRSDLLGWFHSPDPSLPSSTTPRTRTLSLSPRKRTAAALADSPLAPPTGKTYKLQEFRAPRAAVGVGGAGAGGLGGRVGNVSRAPSRHVDDYERAHTTPSAHAGPTPPAALLFRRDT